MTPAAPTKPPVRFWEPDEVITEYGPPRPIRSSEISADAARLSTCSGTPGLQREGVPEPARRESERERERDAGAEQGPGARAAELRRGGPPRRAAPAARAPARAWPRCRARAASPRCRRLPALSAHRAQATSATGQRSKRVSETEPASGRPHRDERACSDLDRARAAEAAGGRRGRGCRDGEARAHERRERAREAVVLVAREPRRQDRGERERRVLDLHVAVGDVPVGELVGVVQVDRRVDDLAVLPRTGVLHRAEPHGDREDRRADGDQRTRDGAHSAIMAKGKNQGMYV